MEGWKHGSGKRVDNYRRLYYSKRHNKFLFPSLAGAIHGSSCKAENEIFNVVNYKIVLIMLQ